jgi:Asp-tRNA(Asn)/Glu-tRNA(Gln) amidotransferase A subunit family amidase
VSGPVDAVPSRVDGSIARAAFDEALELLAARPLSDVRARVPYDYLLPPMPRSASRHGPVTAERADDRVDGAHRGAGPLTDAIAAVRAGEVSATELTTQALSAVEARNAELVALVEVAAESALATAAALDRAAAAGEPMGPLHGIPITIKDVIDVEGMPTRCANARYFDRPATDAASVARLREAGAVILGKAATHEFALGVTSPQSRNPWDTTRIPGGSSGGSVAAVVSGMGLGSLGTDTRASIRVPAALSGAVGFKATYGRVPTDGVVSLSWTMDHVAPMALTVTDAATLMEVLLADGRPLAEVPAGVAGLRVGVADAAFADAGHDLERVVRTAIERLGEAGAMPSPSDRPDAGDLALANAAGLVVSRVEAATFHRSLGLDLDVYWEEVGDQLRAATELAAVDYVDAQRSRGELARRLLAAFEHHDVLVMPTVPVVAPPVDDFADYLMLLSRNAIPWSFVGFPAVSVPCGRVDGLPVGLQIVAPPDREDLLVAVAKTVEQSNAI